VSGFEYRSASFLPADPDVRAPLTAAEWLGLALFHSAIALRACICGAVVPNRGPVCFEHRRECPVDSLDVCRIVFPKSYGPRPSA
jgi:hypothetical protein